MDRSDDKRDFAREAVLAEIAIIEALVKRGPAQDLPPAVRELEEFIGRAHLRQLRDKL